MQVLTDYINSQYEQNDNSGAIHPSSLGDCDRSPVYQCLGLKKDVPHTQFLKRIFYHGNCIEDWMNDALREKGILIANKIPVKAEIEGVPVEGEIDHIIKWNGGWRIADTKSVSDFALKRYGYDLPYHHHVLQVGAYQWALGHTMRLPHEILVDLLKDTDTAAEPSIYRYLERGHYGEELPPVFFYVGRGNLEETTVEVGDQAQQWAYEKLLILARYIKEDTIPDRPFATPNEHPYLCASCVKKGSRKRNDGTQKTPAVYVPSCSYFGRCWGTLPEKWSFWSEVEK